jgi:CRISPR type III-B/RAMP module RAMP protein Cmr6
MKQPLYLCPGGVAKLREDGHRGLWYDKFCDKWREGWHLKPDPGEKGSPKLAWINEIAGTPVGDPSDIQAYAQRIERLVAARGGAVVAVVSRTRFVTGLGLSHPVENGFAWHPTLGTPYLPGTSLKGLLRAWASNQSGVSEKVLTEVLGDRGQAGLMALLDAVPLQPVKLEADVLTPHYLPWNDTNPPGDWRSPTPVPFLVAAPGLQLLCGIIPLKKEAAEHVETVKTWLRDALEHIGVGAKTSLGYGQFVLDQDGQRMVDGWRREREQKAAMATPEGRWRLKLDGRSEDEVLDLVRTELDAISDPIEKRAFVRTVLDKGWVEKWSRGEKNFPDTHAGKKKLKDYAKAVLAAAAELRIDV